MLDTGVKPDNDKMWLYTQTLSRVCPSTIKETQMVALIFYITVAITVVAVILSVMYWIKERKNRF